MNLTYQINSLQKTFVYKQLILFMDIQKKYGLIIRISLWVFVILISSCKPTQKVSKQENVVKKKVVKELSLNIDSNQIIGSSLVFINDTNLINAHIGICIYEPKTNKYLYNYQSNKYFIPASNVKIATCYAAMKYLGDSLLGLKFFENDSTIYIEGTADPSFLYKSFPTQKVLQWINTKRNKKIVLCDTKFFENPLGKGWAWDDFEEPYMAERSGMPLYGNTVHFYFNKGYKTIPHYFERYINNKVDIVNNNTKFKVLKQLGQNIFDINQGKKDTNEITFSTSQPLNIIEEILADTLHRKVVKGTHIVDQKIYSQPTDSLLKSMMHYSDNFFAEQALLMVSNEKLGLMNDEKIIDTILKTDFKTLPQKPKWVDGCGLSRYNLFTPQDLVYILNKIKNEFNWQRIKNIFPTANEGTLKGFYKNNHNKIFAKTGSLSNNSALSGFLITNKGKELIFSVIINNYQATNKNVRLAIETYISDIIENY